MGNSQTKTRDRVIEQRIKLLREKHGLTQKELGERIGYSDHQVIRWEDKENPTYPNYKALLALSREFSVSIDYLAGLTSEPTGNYESQPLSSLEMRIINALRQKHPQLILYLLSTNEDLWVEEQKPIDNPAPETKSNHK